MYGLKEYELSCSFPISRKIKSIWSWLLTCLIVTLNNSRNRYINWQVVLYLDRSLSRNPTALSANLFQTYILWLCYIYIASRTTTRKTYPLLARCDRLRRRTTWDLNWCLKHWTFLLRQAIEFIKTFSSSWLDCPTLAIIFTPESVRHCRESLSAKRINHALHGGLLRTLCCRLLPSSLSNLAESYGFAASPGQFVV